ncbi:MAG: hypothetical protein PF501_05475 [Salinisphaera sp.]|jgi:uncharacterized membrane protein YagU involved in acid resistance|nr:hypothetical protein [Salinisphaera sp.]
MHLYARGLLAGFCATLVLSAFMIAKTFLGIPPPMSVIHLLAGLGHHLFGTPAAPILGWVAHFAIGTVAWGLIFAALYARLPGSPIVKGLVFGTGAWVLMMIILMPLAGKGLFAAGAGPAVAIATLILHWIYGVALGAVMGAWASRSAVSRSEHAA